MRKILLLLLLSCAPMVVHAVETISLMVKPLPDLSGKEVQMITVLFPPGSHDEIHRHNAYTFVYVLEGSISMGINGKKPVLLTAGQTFFEKPEDVHTTGRNDSTTTPAKLLVVLIKNKDTPILVPVKK